jgi:hypothetical protein
VHRVTERGDLALDRRMPGDVSARHVRPDPDDGDPARGLRGQRLGDHAGPVLCGRATPRHPGVGLEVQPGRPPGEVRGRGDLPDQRGRSRGQVDVVADGLLVRGVGRAEQAQHTRGDARPPQGHSLGYVHDPEPGRAAVQGRERGRDHAVTVAVGLDHRHHLRVADVPVQGPDVVLDRAQVDERLGVTVHAVHEVTVCQPAQAAPARRDGPPGGPAPTRREKPPAGPA